MAKSKRIVVLGGGNGTSRLLMALLPLLTKGEIDSLHALVHMADDGGSTGRLRAQYDAAAVGDLTKCLLALSTLHTDIRGQEFIKALGYRFDRGDFQGHTLRNIFLVALEKTSDLDSAIATLARLLQIPKQSGVVPTTLKPLEQQVEITIKGRRSILGKGQHFIAHNVNLQVDPDWQPEAVRVTFAEGDVPLNPRAAELLAEATHIVIAPGHTYGTILPTLALPALGAAVGQSHAQLITLMTLLTTPWQTEHWTGEDFVRVYESYLMGRTMDAVITNTDTVPVDLVPGQDWVRFQAKKHPYELLAQPLVATETGKPIAGDVVPRAVVVHDHAKLTTLFRSILGG